MIAGTVILLVVSVVLLGVGFGDEIRAWRWWR